MSISFRIANTADGTQRDFLWQYDKNQRVYIDGAIFADGGETVLVPEFVIFSTRERNDAYQVTTQVDSEGKAYAVIPDSVLRDGAKLLVYAYDVVPGSGTQEVIAHATFAVKRRNEETELTPTEEQTIDIEQLLAECRSLKQSVVTLVGQPSDSGSSTLMGQMNDHKDDLETELESVLRGVVTNSIVPAAESTLQSYIDSVSKPALDDHVGSADDDATDGTLMGLLNARVGSSSDPVEADTINGQLNARLVQLESDLESKETSLEGTLDSYVNSTSKPAIDSYVNIKKGELDTYVGADSSSGLKKELSDFTDAQKPAIDSYVNSTSKPALDSYTATKKAQLDAKEAQLESALESYEQAKETDLDAYTGTKKTELDSYVNSTTKPAIDAYEQTKETELDAYTEEKKAEVQAVYAEDLGNVSSRVQSNSKRIANLEDKSAPYTIEYPSDDYGKGDIPANIEKGAVVKSVDGNTRPWIQLIDYSTFGPTTTINGITFTNNNDGSITVSGTASANTLFRLALSSGDTMTALAGHTYMVIGCPSGGSSSTYMLYDNYYGMVETGNGFIWSQSSDRGIVWLIRIISGTAISSPITFRPCVYDLTLYCEGQNVPTTVAEALSLNPEFGKFHAFDTGSLVKLKVGGYRFTSRNLVSGYVAEDGFWNTDGWQSTAGIKSSVKIPVRAGATYIGSFYDKQGNRINDLVYTSFVNEDDTKPTRIVTDSVITLTGNEKYLAVRNYSPQSSYITGNNYQYQLEEGSSATTYHPHASRTVEFSSPVELGKAGSVKDRLDTLDNTVKRNVAEVDLGTPTWSVTTTTNGNNRFQTAIDAVPVQHASSDSTPADVTCAVLLTVSASGTYLESEGIAVTTTGRIVVYGDAYKAMTASEFKSAMSGIKMTYALASPTTEPISLLSAIEVEPYGTIELIQEQDVEIDTEFSVQYIPDSQYLTKSMVVDNLSSESTNVPLSANQGRILGGLVSKAFKAIANLVQRVGTFLVQYPDSIYSRGEVPSGMAKFAEVSCLRGVTRVGNQLIDTSALPTTTSNGITFTPSSDGTITVSGTASADTTYNLYIERTAHTLMWRGCPSGGSISTYYMGTSSSYADVGSGCVRTFSSGNYIISITVLSGTDLTTPITFTPQVIDLTVYFGGSIPSDAQTIADIQQNYPELLVPSDYDAGSIVDITYSAVKSQGVNLFDGESQNGYYDTSTGEFVSSASSWNGNKNRMRVKPNEAYYVYIGSSSTASMGNVLFYDINGNYIGYTATPKNNSFTTPANCAYVNFYANGTYFDSDIQFCLDSYADKTTYHPHFKSVFTLPSPVTLPSAGSVADTDELCVEVDGVEKRRKTVRVGQVDLGTIPNWVLDSDGFYRTTLDDILPLSGSSSIRLTCDKYVPISPQYSGGMSGQADKTICQSANSNGTTKVIYVKDSSGTPTGILNYALEEESVTLTDPIPDNFVLTEGGGTITPRQTQTPEIDTRFDIEYLAL